ncbi:peptide ABC transporter substrate-binding protein [Candidatus Uabimicrobium amorphum]|uniref:Peptide ABC transporter substrate-binding protein n=1 Tax=Uabimicrobium amorphum TaxID=2596890 RepID=A0A5S9INT2_UABAM|nr:peptide ABC transporter substrate-binding protein [Candidatus Uabimicrobium amorphum]BBM85289.1 peptide ABC transporter substrate-binding protein [Candidatus Uabimicrobium amorphum]
MKLYSVLLCVAMLALCSCNSEGRKGELTELEKQGKTVFRFSNAQEPATLDLSKATGVYENRIINLMFEGLIRYGDKGEYSELGVAEKYETKDEQKTYVFTLRKNIKWSDGTSVTAHDFVAAYQRILNPNTGAEYAYMLYDIINAQEINEGKEKDLSALAAKAIDDHTLELRLKQPVPYFIDLLTHYTFYPVPKHVVEKYGSKWTEVENIVGNGAFVLKKRVMGSQMIFEKNEHYWEKDRVKLDRIVAFTTENQETQLRMFRSGMTDWLSSPVPKSAYPTIKQESEWMAPPYLGTYFFCFNTSKKPFDDVRVRKALSIAIDRKIIAENVAMGGQLPAFNYVPKGTFNYESPHKLDESIEEAKKLLAEAGYPDGKGFPEFTILYNTSEDHQKICIIIQNMWQTRLGIPVKIENNEWKTYIDRMHSMNYDVIRRGWIADYNDAYNFMELFMKDGGNNNTGWWNAEHDNLVLATKQETDVKKREVLFQKAEKILLDNMPLIPIYFYVADQMIKPYVRGFYPRNTGNHGQEDIKAGRYNIADNHPITRVWIDMEAKKKYLGIGEK